MANYATEVKLFGRWSFEDVEVKDISLEDYIACKPKFAQFLPHSQGRWQKKRFRKAGCPIVERLVCSMMRYGRNNGKKVMAVRIVKHAFEIIHLLTDQNPVQVLVEAVINCGPREDSTRVGGGGAVRRQACDVSPLRRVNQSIYLLTTGAREASFRNIKTIAECLADEVMNAAKVRLLAVTVQGGLAWDSALRTALAADVGQGVATLRALEEGSGVLGEGSGLRALSSRGPPDANPGTNLLPVVLRRARPTAMPSRRRTRSNALPRATVKHALALSRLTLCRPTCGEVEHRHKTRGHCLNELKLASVLAVSSPFFILISRERRPVAVWSYS